MSNVEAMQSVSESTYTNYLRYLSKVLPSVTDTTRVKISGTHILNKCKAPTMNLLFQYQQFV